MTHCLPGTPCLVVAMLLPSLFALELPPGNPVLVVALISFQEADLVTAFLRCLFEAGVALLGAMATLGKPLVAHPTLLGSF